jgi:hypothetical protein
MASWTRRVLKNVPGGNEQRVNLLARHAREGRVDVAAAGDLDGDDLLPAGRGLRIAQRLIALRIGRVDQHGEPLRCRHQFA